VLLTRIQGVIAGACRAVSLVCSPIRHRFALQLSAALLFVGASAGGCAAQAQPVAAEISVDTSGGFARIVYRFNGDVDANVRMSNGILVIHFSVPVELSTDRLNAAAAGYVSAARRDPDGKGLRVALARKFTLHSMQADDRLFVDLLPDTWNGPPPPLPQELVEELARRAKEVERRRRQIRLLAQQKQMVVTRVRVAHQPNFSRYVFELPDLVAVLAERNGDKLDLQFDAPLKFDLAEAKASLPSMIERIDGETVEQTTTINFVFIGKVDIRSFREDNSYVIDVAAAAAGKLGDTAPARGREETTLSARNETVPSLGMPLTVPAAAQDRSSNSERLGGAPGVSGAAVPALPAGGAAAPKSATAIMRDTPPNMTFNPAREIEAANLAAGPPVVPAEALPVLKGEPPSPRTKPVLVASAKSAAALPAEAEPAVRDTAVAAALAKAEPARPDQAAAVSQATPAMTAPERQADSSEDFERAAADPMAPVKVRLEHQEDNIKLVFPFAAPTSGAIFRRSDMLWAVFDTAAPIDVAALQRDPTMTIGAASVSGGPDFKVVRIKMQRPRLASFSAMDDRWTIAIGDAVLDQTLPLATTRNVGGPSRPSAVIAFDQPQSIRRIADPDVGDTLFVVTGFAPARGLLKEQDFVEFRLLTSTHGVVVQPLADDVDAELAGDRVVVSRPPGLILSPAGQMGRRGYRPVVLDARAWSLDREADFAEPSKGADRRRGRSTRGQAHAGALRARPLLSRA
jgi:hypothetical protein